MLQKSFQIKGMNCNHCVLAVKKELSKLDAEFIEVEIGKATISFDESNTTETQIEAAIAEAGFEVVK